MAAAFNVWYKPQTAGIKDLVSDKLYFQPEFSAKFSSWEFLKNEQFKAVYLAHATQISIIEKNMKSFTKSVKR